MKHFMRVTLVATAFLGPMTAAYADCWYNNQRYSDGAKNDKGQVCDGRSGTWK